VIVLVGTPIGNLSDLSPRARAILEEADVVAAEDTRRARALLSHLGLRKKLVSYHRANERTAGPQLIEVARAGKTVALVADAGMPGISDPGEALVRRALDAGVGVEVVPGPSAVLTALVVSGLRTDRFVFEGFLPRRSGERTRRLEEVAAETRTVVLFEGPHRVAATLADLAAACGGERQVAVARELTKLHETVWRGPLGDAPDAMGEPRGEYVIVVEGSERHASPIDVAGEVAALVAAGRSSRDAVTEVATALGTPRSTVYRSWLARRAASSGSS
jgi:16S rRNA (cytidine1402-2'-O)-methyltransferase